MKTLVVVDMQNDFITGPLGSLYTQNIIPKVITKISRAIENGERIIFTRDTHTDNYLETPEGIKLPVKHCIIGTEGWEIIPEIKEIIEGYPCIYINKPIFGSIELMDYFSNSEEQEIEFIGVCTDICVVSNVLMAKSFFPKAKIFVDDRCCAGTSINNHLSTMDVLKSCQIDFSPQISYTAPAEEEITTFNEMETIDNQGEDI